MIGNILRLIRFPNLLIIIITMLVSRFLVIEAVFSRNHLEMSVGNLPFLLMMLTSVLTAAGGYVLNDYYDLEIDRINCPGRMVLGQSISPVKGHRISIWLLVLGMLSGLTMTLLISRPLSFLIYLFAGLITWGYAVKLKRTFLWGNLSVAFLTTLATALPLLFEIISTTKTNNPEMRIQALKFAAVIISAFAVFAGLLNFAREIIKDIEDIEGDKAMGCLTIPIVLGQDKAKFIAWITGTLIILLLLICHFSLEHNLLIFTGYYVILLILLVLYFLFRLIRSNAPADFHKVSTLLKIIMLSGIVGMLAWFFEYSSTFWIKG